MSRRTPAIAEDRSDRAAPPVRTTLRVGIDIDGTITRAPEHFKRLIEALLDSGNEVHIVTGRDASRRSETVMLLYSLGVRCTSLMMKPVDWPHTIPDFKVEATKDLNLHMLIDDEEETCRAVEERTRALAAHMLPLAESEERAA